MMEIVSVTVDLTSAVEFDFPSMRHSRPRAVKGTLPSLPAGLEEGRNWE